MKITVEGKDYEVRGLTRKELFELKKADIDFKSAIEKMDAEDGGADQVLSKCLVGTDPGDVTPYAASLLLVAASKLTFLGGDEAKNFERSLSTGSPGGSCVAIDANGKDPAAGESPA